METMKIPSLLLVTILLSAFFGCSEAQHTELPEKWDKSFFKDKAKFPEDQVELGTCNDYLLVRVPVEGVMSFSSPNDHIGLYKNGRLVDEIVLGWIPMEMVLWTDKVIKLRVTANREKDYLDSWLNQKDAQKIGEFVVEYIY
jgi:hypothetical protein